MANNKPSPPEEPGTALDYVPGKSFAEVAGIPPPVTPVPEEIMEQARPPYISGTIDVSEFVKAQSKFIAAQSSFTRRKHEGPEVFLAQLTEYSLAQDEYIQAMTSVLSDLGVV